jgi:uncharacterized protein
MSTTTRNVEIPKFKPDMLIGLISDTHGLIRPEALNALRRSDAIIHAGDVGDSAVLEELRAIAPVHAIGGNNDRDSWARDLPSRELLKLGGQSIYVIHNLTELDLDLEAAGVTVVVSGHSHKPLIEKRDAILFINPGSAGPRRFKLPVTIAQLVIGPSRCEARIISLETNPTTRRD